MSRFVFQRVIMTSIVLVPRIVHFIKNFVEEILSWYD